jgi:hypothetical protein
MHPTREIETDDGTREFMPDFQYRYFTEDFPMGLVRDARDRRARPTFPPPTWMKDFDDFLLANEYIF